MPSAPRSSAGSARERRDRDHRQPRQHRLPGAQAAVAAQARARGRRPGRQAAAAQGLHPPAADRRARDRRRGRLGHAVPRPAPPRATATRCWPRSTCRAACCRRCSRGPRSPAGSTAAAAAATGLPAGTPVVAGGGDNACAAIGAGLIEEGHGVCSLGTSGTLFVHSMTPAHRPRGRAQRLLRLGARRLPPDGRDPRPPAARLSWFRDKIAAAEADLLAANGLDPFAVLLDEAAARAGRRRRPAVPALPRRRALAAHGPACARRLGRAQPRPRPPALVRALIEGVGFAFADCLERMRDAGRRAAGHHAHRRRCARRPLAHRSWRPSCACR